MNEDVLKQLLGEMLESELAEYNDPPECKFSLKHRLAMKRIFARYEKNVQELKERSFGTAAPIKHRKSLPDLKKRLLIALCIIVLMTLLVGWIAVRRVSGEKLTFSIRGQEYQGEFIDEINRRGNRQIEFVSYVPTDMSNYAMIINLDVPVGDNIKVIDDVVILENLFGERADENSFEAADNEICYYTRTERIPINNNPAYDRVYEWGGVRNGENVSASVYWDYDNDNGIMSVTIKADCY